jgi:hypothetical protein
MHYDRQPTIWRNVPLIAVVSCSLISSVVSNAQESEDSRSTAAGTAKAYFTEITKAQPDVEVVKSFFLTEERLHSMFECPAGQTLPEDMVSDFLGETGEGREFAVQQAKRGGHQAFAYSFVRFDTKKEGVEKAGIKVGECTSKSDMAFIKGELIFSGTDEGETGEMVEKVHLMMVAGRYYLSRLPEWDFSLSKDEWVLKECRDLCRETVRNIREAEQAYDAEYDDYVAIPWVPSANPSGLETVKWPTNNELFMKLGWHPDGNRTQAVYTVRVQSEGGSKDFEVFGKVDCDGDGIPAMYKATNADRTEALTPETVW